MYLAPACFFWLMLGVAAVEWPAMRDNNALQLIANKPVTYFAAAAMGFCVNLLAYMVIQTASSLTLKVCIDPDFSKRQPLLCMTAVGRTSFFGIQPYLTLTPNVINWY